MVILATYKVCDLRIIYPDSASEDLAPWKRTRSLRAGSLTAGSGTLGKRWGGGGGGRQTCKS